MYTPDVDEAKSLELANEGDGVLALLMDPTTIHNLSTSFISVPNILVGGRVLLPPRNDGGSGIGRR
eukprot:CAMPEP_0197721534 /NCGR_PEP_ID=MMETSP1434-20131217/4546_1 /TAXON_ID=265543 /ORGANISM="Minutocellus polymorphus, Strain CCMP3303" /LENGTH=65 /DNA_ID=CAMNT_0043306555 /DNA_START=422 /DNA_END=616 /DNA_ORIENTATION=-